MNKKDINYKQIMFNTLSMLDALDFFDKKYYGVVVENEVIWETLYNYTIDKCKFIEFGIGVDTTHPTFDNLQISGLPPFSREDRITQFKNTFETLKQIGLQDNVIHFYSTKRNFHRNFPYDWYIARLRLDEKLESILESKKSLMDYIDDEINGVEFEFSDPVFYGKDGTALMFCIHSEVKAYILLEENEKVKLEQQGIQFEDELERPLNNTLPKNIVTLEEMKLL